MVYKIAIYITYSIHWKKKENGKSRRASDKKEASKKDMETKGTLVFCPKDFFYRMIYVTIKPPGNFVVNRKKL